MSVVPIGKILHLLHSQFRRDVFHNLVVNGECDVGTLTSSLSRSYPCVSQELGNLWSCGLVECRQVGEHVIYWPSRQAHASCTAGILHLGLVAMNADDLSLNLHYPPFDSFLGTERTAE